MNRALNIVSFSGTLKARTEELTHFFGTEEVTSPESRNMPLYELVLLDPTRLWLIFAVLTGKIPTPSQMSEMTFLCEIGKPDKAINFAARNSPRSWRVLGRSDFVHVVVDAVFVDVHHTCNTTLATGIQRVVKETVKSWWESGHELVLAKWANTDDSFINLSEQNSRNMGIIPKEKAINQRDEGIIVPWRSHVVLPELAIEPERTLRLLSLAESSGNLFYGLGFDCIPVTTAETVAPGMASAFSNYLSVLAHAQTVAPISLASAKEFNGWRQMLPSRGLLGPRIRPVVLPEVAPLQNLVELPNVLVSELPDSPIVLCVGSHEPRKNHLTLLFAAELLWNCGANFSLVFIGGNSWNVEDFDVRFETLKSKGRPIFKFTKATDRFMREMFERSKLTVFPSLNEGFGLPITESLALGTPCITSNFGSMAEIADGGGCLTVNPRDPVALAEAIEKLLMDDMAYSKLCHEALHRTKKTWSEYAEELWQSFFSQ